VSTSDDVPVASGSYKDIGAMSSILHGGDFIASHRSLESVDGIDLGDKNAGTVGTERLGAL